MKNVLVARVISKAIEARSKKAAIDQEWVLTELASLARSNVNHYQIGKTGRLELAPGAPPNAMAAVRSVKYRRRTEGTGKNAVTTNEVEFTLWDKPGTLKLAGRHVDTHGFSDKVEVTGKDGAPLIPTRDDAIKALRMIAAPGAAKADPVKE